MVHSGMSQLQEFTRLTEKYSFSALISLHEESVLVGQTTSITVKPHLSINNRTADLKLLKNCKVTIQTSSYMEATKITREHDATFENEKECVIPIQIPPNLASISVTVDAQVLNAST